MKTDILSNMKTLKDYTTDIQADDALAVAVHGEQGSGKTRFAITAPDPIGVIPLDRKCRKTVQRISTELGKTIIMPKADFIRVENPMRLATMSVEAAKSHYRKHIDAVKKAAFDLLPYCKTIVIDTGTQLWEDMSFAHYGRADRIMPRDRGPMNKEMIEFLNCLSERHLIVTHKSKEIWKNDKPTGKFELAGFPHIGYHVNVIAEMKVDDEKREEDEGRFTMDIKMCQDNPNIQGPGGKAKETGLMDEGITFTNMAVLIYPDSDMEDWN